MSKLVNFDQLLGFIYEVQGYLCEQSDEEALVLEEEATRLLAESGYALALMEVD